MRVTERSSHLNRISYMAKAREGLEAISEQVSSGRKFTRPGQNPQGAAHLVRLSRVTADLKRYQENITVGSGMLTAAESALDGMISTVNDARQLALRMADAFYDGKGPDQLPLVDSMIETMIDLGNASFDDVYVFAGFLNDQPPFAGGGGAAVTYAGDAGNLELDVGENSRVQVNTDPGALINGGGGNVDVFGLLVELRTHLANNDRAQVSGIRDSFETSVAQLTRATSELGARFQQLSHHENVNDLRDIDISQLRSTIEDTDYAEAATTLNMMQTGYEASLAAASRMQGLSLLNFMR
jgi:flagellar hook-associated protein 3 FlgL